MAGSDAMSPRTRNAATTKAVMAVGNDDPLRFSRGASEAIPFPTVTAAFFHHARAHPHALAARDLSSAVREMDYATLASRSRRLAHCLRKLGVLPGDRIPIVVKRGIEMLVGILAVLACGAQYVPLDGGVVPDSTLGFVLEQAGAPGRRTVALCLASTEYRVQAVRQDCLAVVIPADGADVEEEEGDEYEMATDEFVDLATPDHGCYVIYTSGEFGPGFPLPI